MVLALTGLLVRYRNPPPSGVWFIELRVIDGETSTKYQYKPFEWWIIPNSPSETFPSNLFVFLMIIRNVS